VLTMLSLSVAHCENSRRTVARDTHDNQLWTLRRVVVEWRRRRDRSSHYGSVFRHWSRQSCELTQCRWQHTLTACWRQFSPTKTLELQVKGGVFVTTGLLYNTTYHNRRE